MSFASKLKKVVSIDEAQFLFEKEVKRLGTLDLYKSSETRYMKRIEQVQRDIYQHLDRIGVSGILFLYEDMLLSQFIDDFSTIDSQDNDLERDRRFFKLLFFGIFVWIVGLYSISYCMQNFSSKTIGTTGSKTIVKSKTDNEETEMLVDDTMVWNKYRGSYTDWETLNLDEQWANLSSVN